MDKLYEKYLTEGQAITYSDPLAQELNGLQHWAIEAVKMAEYGNYKGAKDNLNSMMKRINSLKKEFKL